MAYIRCGSGGGEFSETVLWTNPDPTATRSATTYTLSESVRNYKYIKLYYNQSRTQTTTRYSIIVPVDDFVNIAQTGDPAQNICFGVRAGSDRWMRMLFYVSDTSFHVTGACKWTTTTTSANPAIPYQFCGLK